MPTAGVSVQLFPTADEPDWLARVGAKDPNLAEASPGLAVLEMANDELVAGQALELLRSSSTTAPV